MAFGYRVVSYDIASLQATTLEARNPITLEPGSIHKLDDGLPLAIDVEATKHQLGGIQGENVILAYDFNEKDIVEGNLASDPEILVRKGTLVEARFANPYVQEKYGHLFNQDNIADRRNIHRGHALSLSVGNTSVAIVRAMDSRSRHIHPMDYVYLLPSGAFYATAKRVLKAYEEGNPVRPGLEKALMKTLEHAVTTAIYEEEVQNIGFCITSSTNVYKASNEGECFYDAESPLPVKMLFEISPQGDVALVEKERELSAGLGR